LESNDWKGKRAVEMQSTETVRDVLEERLKTLLEERIGTLLPESSKKKSGPDMFSELARELADEAVSVLGIRESDLNEPWFEECGDEEEGNEEKERCE
jgi:hypothetical protein